MRRKTIRQNTCGDQPKTRFYETYFENNFGPVKKSAINQAIKLSKGVAKKGHGDRNGKVFFHSAPLESGIFVVKSCTNRSAREKCVHHVQGRNGTQRNYEGAAGPERKNLTAKGESSGIWSWGRRNWKRACKSRPFGSLASTTFACFQNGFTKKLDDSTHSKSSYEQVPLHTACFTYLGFYLLMILGKLWRDESASGFLRSIISAFVCQDTSIKCSSLRRLPPRSTAM